MKEKFLKDLEKKLSVLSDDERKDTINEYSDIIDEKIKHGKTEEEAVKEFGDVKELSQEILKAYKINPDYNKNDFSDKTNEFIKNSEDLIKKGAQKLSDVTEEVVDGIKNGNNNLDLTQIFEIVIKVIIVLVFLAILKIPFYIIGEIGEGIFDIGSFPFGGLTGFVWRIIIEVAYIAVCILLIIVVVSKYTKNNNTTKKENVIKQEKKETPDSKKKETDVKYQKSSDTNDGLSTFLLVLVKIWSVILILFPLWCVEMGMIISICVAIFLIIKGIGIYGILLLLFGIFGMFSYFTDIVWKLLFSKRNIHIYPIFINMILIVFGGLLTFDYFTNLEYKNELPNNIKLTTDSYERTINEKLIVDDQYKIIVDNKLEDNKIKIELTYYDEVYDKVDVNLIEGTNSSSLKIKKDYENEIVFWNNKLFNKFVDNLKDKEIYNYRLLEDINVKIYSNSSTIDLYMK